MSPFEAGNKDEFKVRTKVATATGRGRLTRYHSPEALSFNFYGNAASAPVDRHGTRDRSVRPPAVITCSGSVMRDSGSEALCCPQRGEADQIFSAECSAKTGNAQPENQTLILKAAR